MQRSELLIPPSTASSSSLCPLSFSIASRIAFVWKHVASNVALAMWPLWVCAVMPKMVPFASSIQYGAKRPLNAVTKTQPPLSSTEEATSLTLALSRKKPRLFIRNLTEDPATAMEPSRAYTGGIFWLRKSYATVARRPWLEMTGVSPTLYNRKHPVP